MRGQTRARTPRSAHELSIQPGVQKHELPSHRSGEPELSVAVDLLRAPTVSVGGVPFIITQIEDAAKWIATPEKLPTGVPVRLANAYCVAHCAKDPAYKDLLTGEGINLPDGTPVYWVMRLIARNSGNRPGRVRGPSLFRATLAQGQTLQTKHFLLGSSPKTLELLEKSIESLYPDARIAGSLSPEYGPLDDQKVQQWAKQIGDSNASVVWVGLGTPKQDFAAVRLAQLTGLRCVAVGAAFDFLAGTQKEAPVWIQRASLEWAFRLASEPRRLWRRYLVGNFVFAHRVLRHYRGAIDK